MPLLFVDHPVTAAAIDKHGLGSSARQPAPDPAAHVLPVHRAAPGQRVPLHRLRREPGGVLLPRPPGLDSPDEDRATGGPGRERRSLRVRLRRRTRLPGRPVQVPPQGTPAGCFALGHNRRRPRTAWIRLAFRRGQDRDHHRLERAHRLRGRNLPRRARLARARHRQQHAARLLRARRRHDVEPRAPASRDEALRRTTTSTSATAPRSSGSSPRPSPTSSSTAPPNRRTTWRRQRPFDDFDINAVGTLNLLEAAREHCPESAVRLHVHEQGVRRRAERVAARRARDPLGLRRRGATRRHRRDAAGST